MSSLKVIETAVENLTEREYCQLRQWFFEQDWKKWDSEIETDSATGKLDFLIQEAKEAKNSGNLQDL